jgi:hypothetical protein
LSIEFLEAHDFWATGEGDHIKKTPWQTATGIHKGNGHMLQILDDFGTFSSLSSFGFWKRLLE